MATMPKKTLVEKIDAVQLESYPRPHLGYSIIGSPCKRSVVYQYYWTHTKTVDARLNRIFRAGDDIEIRLVEALRSVGVGVSAETETGDQHRVSDSTGHAGGSLDGILTNLPDFEGQEVVFEGKSMNHTNFLDMKRKGVQLSKPTHYVQMNMYMGRKRLHFALYMALDKNTSEIYCEMVPFDENCYDTHNNFADEVLGCSHINEFPKISHNPSWFLCKTCDAKGVCHGGDPVRENCRTCEHSRMVETGGDWTCRIHNHYLTPELQEKGCNAFELSDMWK